MEVKLNAFLISALNGNEQAASRLGRFYPGERALYPLNRGLDLPHNRSTCGEAANSYPYWSLPGHNQSLTELLRLICRRHRQSH